MRFLDFFGITRRIKLYGYKRLLCFENFVSIHSHVMISPHHPSPKGFEKISKSGFTIGKNCIINENVNIDTTGNVIMDNNVKIGVDVLIFTHIHNLFTKPKVPVDDITATTLKIDDGVVIGARAIILSSCHYIGKNARIGAGAVVTKDIPDNAIAVGVPAKVVKYLEL